MGAAPAHAAETVVGHLLRPSTIRAYAGTQVFSSFDGRAYRLAVRRAGRVETLPVASSRAPFDVDIGPDGQGRPELIYTRCRVEQGAVDVGTNDSRGCDLVVLPLVAGGVERPVRNANTADDNEFAPTLWKGRIAFARRVRGRDRPVVLTKALGAPRSRPSERLPGVPGRSSSRGVLELDLHGDRLAQLLRFGRESEVRLVDLSDHGVRRLSRVGVGEGGEFFAGIGFAGGHLAWALNCLVSCEPLDAGIYRYDVSTPALARADLPATPGGAVVGLALFAADGAYMVDALPQDGGCGDELAPMPRECRVIRTRPLAFGPA